jgi:hypothetical protein
MAIILIYRSGRLCSPHFPAPPKLTKVDPTRAQCSRAQSEIEKRDCQLSNNQCISCSVPLAELNIMFRCLCFAVRPVRELRRGRHGVIRIVTCVEVAAGWRLAGPCRHIRGLRHLPQRPLHIDGVLNPNSFKLNARSAFSLSMRDRFGELA